MLAPYGRDSIQDVTKFQICDRLVATQGGLSMTRQNGGSCYWSDCCGVRRRSFRVSVGVVGTRVIVATEGVRKHRR